MHICGTLLASAALLLANGAVPAQDADLILHHGKVVTADKAFSLHQAIAVKDGRILQVGSDDAVMRTRGPNSKVIDLAGKMVMPGLIDSHVHPGAAAMTEFDHPIPEMESIADVLAHVRARAHELPAGEWIELHQVFITRLREQRYPTRQELDEAAPHHPVVFATGPDASLNTLAMKASGIKEDFKVTDGGPGHAERDPKSGALTGILRSCTRYVKSQPTGRQPSDADRIERLRALFKDYNSVGLTSVADRDASSSDVERYRKLLAGNLLTLRVAISQHVDTLGAIEKIQAKIKVIAKDPLHQGDARLRIIGIKTYLDGGMLTGSAFMRKPWGLSKIYSITDPDYRGVRFIPKERLTPIVQTTLESGLQFTAHSVGDGAVHALLEVYEEASRKMPLGPTRPCITHANFLSREAIDTAAKLGVLLDIQPAWLYLDTRTLTAQFGYDRLRYFQPLRSLFEAGVMAGGGSDHMQKIGSLRSVNPYNPYLAMWTTITRKAKGYEGRLHPEEALSREQAIRFYTINNAHLLFLEKEIGSLEPGKRADLIVLDRDLLSCPEDDIRDARCLQTYLEGRMVYEQK